MFDADGFAVAYDETGVAPPIHLEDHLDQTVCMSGSGEFFVVTHRNGVKVVFGLTMRCQRFSELAVVAPTRVSGTELRLSAWWLSVPRQSFKCFWQMTELYKILGMHLQWDRLEAGVVVSSSVVTTA